jgi:hypothetical protein
MKPKKQRPQTKKSGPMLETKKSGLALDPKDRQGRLRFIGWSASDHWNSILVNSGQQQSSRRLAPHLLRPGGTQLFDLSVTLGDGPKTSGLNLESWPQAAFI